MAYLKSKWFLALWDNLPFKKANKINSFVKSDVSIFAISYGMAVETTPRARGLSRKGIEQGKIVATQPKLTSEESPDKKPTRFKPLVAPV